MKTLIVGATGATGRHLVTQLLDRGVDVHVIVRSPDRLPKDVLDHAGLTVTTANLLDLDDGTLAEVAHGCGAVASCLGHTLNLRGIFGSPRRLVTDAVRRLGQAIVAARADDQQMPRTKFVLMNTTGVRNADLEEPRSFAERCVIGLLRVGLPPHADNEQAADFLRTTIGQDHPAIEWSAVRPDGLTNDEPDSAYDLHPSPIRSAIFDSGHTRRVNVAHFMAELITDADTWAAWAGRMPVIYDAAAG